jgi:hypothetical protein
MEIEVPIERVYFAPENKITDVMLWIPESILRAMVEKGQVRESILENYPKGLEVSIKKDDLDNFEKNYGLNTNIHPEEIILAFERACKRNLVSRKDSYLVIKAEDLEGYIEKKFNSEKISELKYSKGESAIKVFRDLSKRQSTE